MSTIAAAAPDEEPDDLTVINGGIEITVTKTDGSVEQVRVRQLPLSLLQAYVDSLGNIADAIELLCDRQDRTTYWHLRNAHLREQRLLQDLPRVPFPQLGEVEAALNKAREEIAAHEGKPRWSDTLNDDSAMEIIKLGDQLNRKRFAQWTEAKATLAGQIRTTVETASRSASSSPPSA